MRVVEEFSVSKSPKEVFEYIAVDYFENHHKFDPEIKDMIKRSEGKIAKGTKGAEVRSFAGKRIVLDFEVTEFVTPEYFAFKNTSGPFYLNRAYRLEPDGTGTSVEFTFDIRPRNLPIKMVFPLLSGGFRKSVAQNIQNLRDILAN